MSLEEESTHVFLKYLDKADRDRFEKQLKEVWGPEIEKCKIIEDFDERVECKSEVLHGISASQDLVNLSVRGDFFKSDPEASKDSRWEVVHMLDDANAVFLGVSEARYDPELFMRWHYVEPKADSFCRRWRWVLSNHKDESEDKLRKRTEEDRAESIEKYGAEEWEKIKETL